MHTQHRTVTDEIHVCIYRTKVTSSIHILHAYYNATGAVAADTSRILKSVRLVWVFEHTRKAPANKRRFIFDIISSPFEYEYNCMHTVYSKLHL